MDAPVVLSSDDEDELADDKQGNHVMRFDVKQEPFIEVKREVVILPMSARNPEEVGNFVPPEVGGFCSRYGKFIFRSEPQSVIVA